MSTVLRTRPPVNARPRRRPPASSHPYWVLAVSGVCVAFLLLILLHPQLREQRFAQSIAGLLLALLIAVVLFSLFPPTAGIPIALGTATGFYLLLFPRIQSALFPNREILGTVTYQHSERGVPGARVRIRNSGQAAVADSFGEFVLRRVAADVSELVLSAEGFDTVVPLSRNGVYAVVPEMKRIETLPRQVPAAAWAEEPGDRCPQQGAPSRLFVLDTSIAVDSTEHAELRGKQVQGLVLHVRVAPRGRGTILDAQSAGPLPGWEDSPSSERPNWKWSFPVGNQGAVPIRLEVCYSPDQPSPASGPAVGATYWIQARHRAAAPGRREGQ